MAIPSTSTRCIDGSSMLCGSSDRMFAIALRTSFTARSAGVSSWNSTVVTDTPSEMLDVMCLTPTTPAAAFSTFFVTWVSNSLGAAPVWVTVMVTMGMSILGICVIGSVFRLTAPSTITTTKNTNDGMGLRIDQAEMLRAISTSTRGSRVIADGHDPFARSGEGCGASDDLLAFNQTVDDFDTGAAFEAGFDITDFDDIVRRN